MRVRRRLLVLSFAIACIATACGGSVPQARIVVEDDELVGFAARTGEVVFRRDVAAVWSITFGESVILLTSGATLEVLGSNGSLAWKVELADLSQSARAADGMVLAGTGQTTVAFDEETGREVWRGDGLVSRTGEGFAMGIIYVSNRS